MFSLLLILLNTGNVFADSHKNSTNKEVTSVTVSNLNPFIVCIKNDGNLLYVAQHETRTELLEFFGIEESQKMWAENSMKNFLFCTTENRVILGRSIIDLFLKYYGYKETL